MTDKLYWRKPITQAVWDVLTAFERFHDTDDDDVNPTTARELQVLIAAAALSNIQDMDDADTTKEVE
jgi:hypothetical protein